MPFNKTRESHFGNKCNLGLSTKVDLKPANITEANHARKSRSVTRVESGPACVVPRVN